MTVTWSTIHYLYTDSQLVPCTTSSLTGSSLWQVDWPGTRNSWCYPIKKLKLGRILNRYFFRLYLLTTRWNFSLFRVSPVLRYLAIIYTLARTLCLSGSLESVGLFGSTLIQIDTLGTLFSGRKRDLEDNIQIIDTSVCSYSNYLFFSIRWHASCKTICISFGQDNFTTRKKRHGLVL